MVIYFFFFLLFFKENFYGRPLLIADRELCEANIDDILKEAKLKDIALLVVGDPLGATTHTDMLLRAKEFEVKTQVNNTYIRPTTENINLYKTT